MTRLAGRLIADRYQIDTVVSSGASTIITEAIDVESDRPVTVKIVRPELAFASSFRTAFAERVLVAKSLAHPNIAAVLDSGEVDIDGDTTLFWVVEYLGGGSLRDIFDRGRLLEPSQALVVGLEACRALDAAHERGVIHTEVTPSKLVFGTDGRLRIVDFAMAELMGAEAWREPATVATHVARYASPEQALSLDVDAKTDVYALSLCLLEAVTGRVPFAGDSTVSTLAGRVGKLMPVTADMGSLASVLERGGRPDPEDRWTAAEFGAALVRAAGKLPRPQPIPVLSASIFASALAARHAAAAATAPAPETFRDDATLDDALDDAPAVTSDEAPPGDTVLDDAVLDDTVLDGATLDDATLDDDVLDDDVLVDDIDVVDVADVAPDRPAEPIPDDTDDVDDAATAADPEPGPSTVEMPASVAAAAAFATTPATTQMGVVEPEPSAPSKTIYDDEQPKRPWSKYLLLGLIVLVGVAALSYAGWLLLRTKSFEVPDLVGVDEAIAMNEISGNGWEIETERERSDEVPDIGHVVRTNPASGERLDEGETFVLWVSEGPELRTLPDLDGLPIGEATSALEDLRLVVVELEREYSETVPTDAVIRWQVRDDASLTAGAQVLPDTVIELTVSLGAEPRPAPDLTNMTPEEATAALDALQLVYAPADDVFSADIEAGRIAAQSPAPTTAVERGGAVTVQVSKGPELVPIPDLAGMTYPAAQTALADAGYVINSLLGTTEGTFVSMSVGGAEANAGDTFPRGTGVDLVFL